MFERFTDRARRVLVLAQEEARLLNHSFIGTEHILLGLIHEGSGVAAQVLESRGVSLEAARIKVEEIVGPAGSPTLASRAFTPRAKMVLELSLRESMRLHDNYIDTEHLLLGLLREGAGVAYQVLESLGTDLVAVRQQAMKPRRVVSERPRPTGPRCPSCRGVLEGEVAYRVLAVEPEDSGAGPLSVAFVYCRRCGVTVAHDPTGQSYTTRSLLIRGRTSPIRRFPDELWNAPSPPAVPSAAIVDVRHTGRSGESGPLIGTVAGSTIDLSLGLHISASSATGSIDDVAVNVAWNVLYDSATDRELAATLDGTVGDQPVNLRGLFRHRSDYLFDHATVGGSLAGIDLNVSIERASGAYDSTDTIVATGTLGDQSFKVFVGLGGSLDRGRVRGTYDGEAVHLDLTSPYGADAHVVGACPSPPSFAVLLIGSLLFFV